MNGRKKRGGVRRRWIKRAAAVKVGSGRLEGERGWGWAGVGDAPSQNFDLLVETAPDRRRWGHEGGGWMTGGELVGSGCTRGQAAGAMQIAQGGGAAHRHEDCGAERKVLMNGRSPQER